MNTAKPIIIGVIPSRYASQRLSAKPLVDLLGKPMVQRVYEQAKKARLLDRVVVATDDARIERCVRGFDGEAILTSPDIQSGSDRVAVIASQMDGSIFVNIQGDEPLIAPEMIDQAVRILLEDPSVQVGTLVKKIDAAADLMNPNVVKVVLNHHMHALYFSRATIPFVRDEIDTAKWIEAHTFYKHIGLYVFRREFLMQYSNMPASFLEKSEKLEQLRILEAGNIIKTGITEFDSVPIDTKEDVERVIGILQRTVSDLKEGI
jgi:3-deoxy-manno-octulosonate cytidylyltransferase (CMP-KDO synthetase)